jgi:hypothetical protein
MRKETISSCCMAAFLFLGMQSLSEIAREEAERRRLLEQQGVTEKIIEGDSKKWAPNGAITQETVPPAASAKTAPSSKTDNPRSSARNCRSVLQKLDKDVLQEEARLTVKQERLRALQKAPPRISSRTIVNPIVNTMARLQSEIEDIEEKLKQLRRERTEKYEEGLKAGCLPGELDGKGTF